MPKAFPIEFRRDVIAEGRRPGVSQAESAQLREANERIRLLEAENEVFPAGGACIWDGA